MRDRFKLIAAVNVYDDNGYLQDVGIYWDKQVGAPIGLDMSHIEQEDSFHNPYTGEMLEYEDFQAF